MPCQVKTTNDLFALMSDAYEVTSDHRMVLKAARGGVPPTVKLDAAYAQREPSPRARLLPACSRALSPAEREVEARGPRQVQVCRRDDDHDPGRRAAASRTAHRAPRATWRVACIAHWGCRVLERDGFSVTRCYAMLSYAMLCYAMLCLLQARRRR